METPINKKRQVVEYASFKGRINVVIGEFLIAMRVYTGGWGVTKILTFTGNHSYHQHGNEKYGSFNRDIC